jgi:hypothetical protein
LNWNNVCTLDLLSRVRCVFIALQDGIGSQNEICKLAKLSPKTYRKYRDEHIEDLEHEYVEYNKLCYEKVRNFMTWNLLSFAKYGHKEFDKLGVNDTDKFTEIMEFKGFPFLVECINECYGTLTPDEIKMLSKPL